MFLKIKKNVDSLYDISLEYFSIDYINLLNSKESIVSRYIISHEIEKKYKINKYLPILDENGIPLFDNGIFWSISHKDNLIFVGIHNEMIGVDIEIYKERDFSVLNQFSDNEYNILGGKNWDNFYVLWTAKESVIKFNLSSLNDLSKIELIGENNINEEFSNISFSKKLLLTYNSIINQVYFGKKEDMFYSICVNSMLQ